MHLTVTSPPYDKIRDYNKDWTLDLPSIGDALFQCTVTGGLVALVMQDSSLDGAKTLTSFSTVIEWCRRGWRLFECVIWHRDGSPGAWWNHRFRVDHEYIFLFLKGQRPRVFSKE